jgi:hypothetical protein
MQILEAALAFAITMLVLSLVCSSLVELYHRARRLREAGLKYLLEQMFDQVLKKYIEPEIERAAKAAGKPAEEFLADVKHSFVERMRANRSPGGVPMQTSLAAPMKKQEAPIDWTFGLLGGREMTSLSPAEFMERLGSIDLGKVDLPETLKALNEAANRTAAEAADKAGGIAAGAVDAVLKDVAQKFEAIGKEASSYFEGRARLFSVLVAIVLAFLININAIDLFNTFLRDPNVRAKVIEQTEAVTKRFTDAQAAEAMAKEALAKAQAAAQAAAGQAANRAPLTDEDKKKAVDEAKALQEQAKKTIEETNKAVAQLSDLGVPIGWDKAKVTLDPFPIVCQKEGQPDYWVTSKGKCKPDEVGKSDYWAWTKLVFALLLGGLLVGLGGPFWYDAVMGLSNIRNIATSVLGSKPQQQPTLMATRTSGDTKAEEKPQPKTPVDIFEAARSARKAITDAQAGGGASL